MLKRKFSNYPDYKLTTKFTAKTEYLSNDDFTGFITIFRFEELKKPLITSYNNQSYTIADTNYIWLQMLPKDKYYCITTLIDDNMQIIEWYFDIIKAQGVIDGIPYFDDIYLDVIVSPKFHTYLIDEDELQAALEQNIITLEDYRNAYLAAEQIIKTYANTDNLTKFSLKYLNIMLDKI